MKPWNASAGVQGFASAALFYRSLLYRMPLAADDKDALRAHLDIHQAIGRLEAKGPSEEAAAVGAWLVAELGRGPTPGCSAAYANARRELLSLLAQALAKGDAPPREAAVFMNESSG